MKVIDKRGASYTTFGEFNFGAAFQDAEGDICIKTDNDLAICWTGDQWILCHFCEDESVLPLEVTYTFENMGSGE